MADSARLDELRRQHAAHPRRYFAPLASALRRAGDAAGAVATARAGLMDAPEHLTGYVILGQALADLGDQAGARSAFARAHALDEGNVVALQSLVAIARADGDDAAATHWLGLLREADPEPEGVHSTQAPEREPADFELLDYDEIQPAAPNDESLGEVASEADRAEGYDFEPLDDVFEPGVVDRAAPEVADVPDAEALAADPLDPVVGLDAAPADPVPAPLREALPELLDDTAAELWPVDGLDRLDEVQEATPSTPPAAPFVTETMAGLLAQQGHVEQALAVYAQLLARRPGDERLLARVAELRGAVAVPAHQAGVEAVAVENGPVDDAPGEALPPAALEDPHAAPRSTEQPPADDGSDERAARMWRAAMGPIPAEAEAAPAPPQPAADDPLDDLSFDRFFPEAEPAPPAQPLGDFERWAAEVDRAPAAPGALAFDDTALGRRPTPAASLAPVPPMPPDDPDADLAEFDAWLRSLAG